MTENRPEAAAPAEPPAAVLPSPGALLRQARERAGIGAEDLAGQLKLAKGTLEALERDDFAALSEPVYVRGYYRKIAKVLPVKESELIDAYNARSKPVPVVPAMKRIPLAGGVDAGASRQYRGQGIGLAVAVVVLAVILLVVANREPPAPQVAEPPAAEMSAAGAVAPSAAGPDRAAQPPATAAAPATTPSPAPAQGAVPAPATASPAPAPSAPAGKALAPAPAAPPAVANQLVMDFSESSFVRVEDNRGKTLAIGLVRAGERQVLDGQPPYVVFLGSAQNVKLWFGGQPVDFSAHVNPQNETARFTVP